MKVTCPWITCDSNSEGPNPVKLGISGYCKLDTIELITVGDSPKFEDVDDWGSLEPDDMMVCNDYTRNGEPHEPNI